MTKMLPCPARGAPIEEFRAYVAQFTNLDDWPELTPERLERLRALWGFNSPKAEK